MERYRYRIYVQFGVLCLSTDTMLHSMRRYCLYDVGPAKWAATAVARVEPLEQAPCMESVLAGLARLLRK